jgi:site-specific DNA recombinase
VAGPGHVNKRMSHVDAHVERHILFFLAKAAHQTAMAPVDAAVLESLRADEAAHRERLNEAARLFADGAIDGEQVSEMSKGIKAKLAIVQARLSEIDEMNARRQQVDISTQIDWADTSSAQEWYGLHVERKRAWIRENLAIILHRHTFGSPRIFDPGTVQIIATASPNSVIPASAVEQWRHDWATWTSKEPYGLMLEPMPMPMPMPGPEVPGGPRRSSNR